MTLFNRLSALAVLTALTGPAASQLITYESVADGAVWATAHAGFYARPADSNSYFGNALHLRGGSGLTWLSITRKTQLLAAGTYRATVWMRKAGTTGLHPIRLTASSAGKELLTVETPASAITVDKSQCMDSFTLSLAGPTAVQFSIHNRDFGAVKLDWYFDSFVLERVGGTGLFHSGVMYRNPTQWNYTKITPSGANGFREVLKVGYPSAQNLYYNSTRWTLPAGEYFGTVRIRRLADSRNSILLRFAVGSRTEHAFHQATSLPIGEWTWLPLLRFNNLSSGTGRFGLELRSYGRHFEIGECMIYAAEPKPELYYKFDRGLGDVAVNYGSAPVTSTVTSIGASPWTTTGKFGASSLRGSGSSTTIDVSYCDTGYKAGFAGNFTFHWWMKQRYAPGSGRRIYLWGGHSRIRCYLNGDTISASGFGTPTLAMTLPTVGDSIVQRAQASGGVCVTLVATGASAQWYVDGAKHGATIALGAAPNVPASTTALKIGKDRTDQFSSAWDLDEFRFCTRAASLAEIRLWCATSTAASGAFGKQCGIALSTSGGAPKVGNGRYTHVINGKPNMVYLFVLGAQTRLPFDMGIVFPALSGCPWYADFLIQVTGTADAQGLGVLPGGLPMDSTLSGLSLDSQVLGFDSAGEYLSNAMSHRVEMN